MANEDASGTIEVCADSVADCARKRRVLVVDLNNFATFPTMSVGVLVSGLRAAGFEVDLICPLAHDVPAAERERREWLFDHAVRRFRMSTSTALTAVQNEARKAWRWWNNRPHPRVLRETARALDTQPDILLLSAYLEHYPSVLELGKLAEARGVPVLLGGAMFNIAATAEEWRRIPGLTAIFGGEVDLVLADLVRAACEGRDLLAFDGVVLPDGRRSPTPAPLRELDRAPTPDFSDFPWDRYRLRVIPVMTGRGCQWNRCVFCSDVVSASGRTFRTRSVDSVLNEMREQSHRHGTRNFVFLDLKLNSSPAMFRGISECIQRVLPGAEWIGTVHVDERKDNGLSRAELHAAVAAGMRRISFGLESGSQRLLDAMDKGASVERNGAFIRDAHEAGLSVRCTMFKGYPGETAADLEQTAWFLEEHSRYLDRVRFNGFSILADTPMYQAYSGSGEQALRSPELKIVDWDHRNATTRYETSTGQSRAYRRALARVLRAVYRINRRPLRISARQFDGLM